MMIPLAVWWFAILQNKRAVYAEMKKTKFSSALILHDEDDTDTRKGKPETLSKGQLIFLLFTTCDEL